MSENSKKPTQPVPIGQLLPNLLGQISNTNAGAGMTQVWQVWAQTVGEAVASNAVPMAFKGSLLLVHASSSTWTHHLYLQKKDLIAKLNHALGSEIINDIRFKVGSF